MSEKWPQCCCSTSWVWSPLRAIWKWLHILRLQQAWRVAFRTKPCVPNCCCRPSLPSECFLEKIGAYFRPSSLNGRDTVWWLFTECFWLQSKECLEKVAQTVSFLAIPNNYRVLLLTGTIYTDHVVCMIHFLLYGILTPNLCFCWGFIGDVQRDNAAELLGLRPCIFRPQHSSKLGNEFRVFTNYDPGLRLGGWEVDN